jgi:hypothetical protein
VMVAGPGAAFFPTVRSTVKWVSSTR